jgi:S1-C subfamily serine protease
VKRGRIALIAIGMAVLSCSGLLASQLREGEKQILRFKPAVVYVEVVAEGRPVWNSRSGPRQFDPIRLASSGTGFIFRPDGYILTNGHVVAPAMESRDTFVSSLRRAALERDIYPYYERQLGRHLTAREQRRIDEELGSSLVIVDMKSQTFVALSNWKFFPAEIKKYSPEIPAGKDVAILKIEAADLPTIPLGDSQKVQLQDPIWAAGYPGAAGIMHPMLSRESALEQTITNGRISALKYDLMGTPVFQTDAAVTHGSSGGPAVDEQGEAIGIVTFGSPNMQTGGEVAGLNFLLPMNTAMEFVRETGIAPQAGLFNQLWFQALDLYDAGKDRKAIAKFDEVLRLVPNQPDALRLETRAQELLSSRTYAQTILEDWGWLLYILVAVAIVAIGGSVYLWRRRAPALAQSSAGAASTRVEPAPGPTIPAATPVPTAPRAFGTLQCTAGSLQGRRFEISKPGLLIGRDGAKCQIVLNDDAVSKEHAWVVPMEGGVFVIDRGSANGVFVNSVDSQRISKVRLQDRDQIYLGKKGTAAFTFFSH